MALSDKGRQMKTEVRELLEGAKEDANNVQTKLKIDKITEIILFSCKKLDEKALADKMGEIRELIGMLREQAAKGIVENVDLIGERLSGILRKIF